MKKEETKSAMSHMRVSGNENTKGDILDRDRPGPVSVAAKRKEKASYEKNVKNDALDRDKPGPVSVAPEGK
jgi:hypothetical protein